MLSAVFPDKSVERHVTTVVPTSKELPEAGEQTVIGPVEKTNGSKSSVADGVWKFTVHCEDAQYTV